MNICFPLQEKLKCKVDNCNNFKNCPKRVKHRSLATCIAIVYLLLRSTKKHLPLLVMLVILVPAGTNSGKIICMKQLLLCL